MSDVIDFLYEAACELPTKQTAFAAIGAGAGATGWVLLGIADVHTSFIAAAFCVCGFAVGRASVHLEQRNGHSPRP